MSTTQFSTLSLQIGDGVGHLRLRRPHLANRFDELAHGEFADALEIVNRDEAVRVILLSAEGRVFSAGGDFDEILAGVTSSRTRERMVRDAKRVFQSLIGTAQPVIVAMQGTAVGLGATIVSLCDISVGFRDAKLIDSHVSIGIAAGDGGIIGWTQSIGIARAKRYLLTGDHMTAAEAHAMGLITDLVDRPEDALPRALEIAHRILALPRGGVEGTKRAFLRLTQQTALTVLDAGLAFEMESLMSPDVVANIARLRKTALPKMPS